MAQASIPVHNRYSWLNATMMYTRVHDLTVAKGYYATMTVIDAKLVTHLHTQPE